LRNCYGGYSAVYVGQSAPLKLCTGSPYMVTFTEGSMRHKQIAVVLATVVAGGALAACEPIRLEPGQLGIDGVEGVQRVQDPGSALVPMIAYKETYVRVYARVGGTRAASGVGATLTVAGSTQRGEPI